MSGEAPASEHDEVRIGQRQPGGQRGELDGGGGGADDEGADGERAGGTGLGEDAPRQWMRPSESPPAGLGSGLN